MSFTAKPVDLRATVDEAGNFHWTVLSGQPGDKEGQIGSVASSFEKAMEGFEEMAKRFWGEGEKR